jgi:transposase
MEKIFARKLSTDAQKGIRYQAVRLKKQGRKRSEISDITGIHQSTISAWWKLYKSGGKKALKIKKRGPDFGSGRTLSPDQEKAL